MRAWRSNGVMLLAALAAAAIASVPLVRDTLGRLLGTTRTDRIDLTAALAVAALTALLIGHARRREVAARHERLAEESRAAHDVGQLVSGSVALAGALDTAQLRVEAWRHVSIMTGGRSAWIAVMTPHDWQWIVEPDAASAVPLLELVPKLWDLADAGTRRHDGWRLFQLGSTGRLRGLLAVDEARPIERGDQQRLEWLAAMLGTAVKNVRHFEQLHMHCVSDGLTGCFNRAHAFASIETELRRAKRTSRPLSVLMLDVDDFKRINDDHGHLCGDAVLQSLGEVLRRTLRTSDVKCRYGGDEFLVILPETPSEGGQVVAEHLRRAVARLRHVGRGGAVGVHVSVGVASALPNETDVFALVARADADLYREKGQRSAAAPIAEATDARAQTVLRSALQR